MPSTLKTVFTCKLKQLQKHLQLIERSRVWLPAGALLGSIGQLSLPTSGVGKSSTSLLAGIKAVRVHLCRVAGNTVWSHVAGDAP